MTAAPELVVEAFEVADDGSRRSLGPQDLTDAVLQHLAPRFGAPREIGTPPRVMMLAQGLCDEARRVGFDGRLALPSYTEALERFLDEAGDRLQDLRRYREDLRSARRRVADAATLLDAVSRARFEPDTSRFDMFCPVDGHEDFVGDLDVHSERLWDAYVTENPRPPSREGEEAEQRWRDGYVDWLRREAAPFAFGTRPEVWRGISAASVREAMIHHGEVRADALIEEAVDELFENAEDHVVDPQEFAALLARWAPHAGSGSAEDLALESEIETWNARQNLTSYWRDETVIVPAFENASEQEALDWCGRNLARAQAALARIENMWPAQDHVPAPA